MGRSSGGGGNKLTKLKNVPGWIYIVVLLLLVIEVVAGLVSQADLTSFEIRINSLNPLQEFLDGKIESLTISKTVTISGGVTTESGEVVVLLCSGKKWENPHNFVADFQRWVKQRSVEC